MCEHHDQPPNQPSIGRILFVDKDIQLLQLMKMALMPEFQLVTVVSAEEGLVLLESEAPFDIIISGFTLFLMNGLEFMRRVAEIYSQTVRILMSGGCGDSVEINRAISEGHISRLVLKPISMFTLLDQLKDDLVTVRAIRIANRQEIAETNQA